MAGSSDANNVPEGTTLVFGSWACTADGLGGFSSHLVTPNSPKPKATQLADIRETVDLNENRVLLELSSDNAENVSTPTRTLGSVEFGANSDSEKPHFSETLGKYVTYLKSIKRLKINNSELLDGVDRVSRSIEGCIKLAESALGSSKV
jgi:outer membrane protein OmpA-like peptidoglycan-associated protein